MDAGAPLGDILGAVLSGAGVALQSPEQLAREAQQRLDADAQYKSALALSRALSPRLGLTEAECFDAMCTIPDNLLSLLCSPQGWTAIASMVAADHGRADPGFMPALH